MLGTATNNNQNVQAAVEENKKKREASRQRNAAIDAEIRQFPNPSTDRDWRMQDRDPSTLRLLSIFGGLFGLDHFYLRSFKTGFLKLLSVFILPGVWWLWDICETAGYSKRLSVRGMRAPFSLFADIGSGTIQPPSDQQTPNNAPPAFEPAKKSILVYMFLTLFLGFLGAHRVYAGCGFRSWGMHMVGMLALAMPYFYDVYTILFHQRDVMLRGVPNLFSPERDGDETTFLPISREQADQQDDQQVASNAEAASRSPFRSLAALAPALGTTVATSSGPRQSATGALASMLQSTAASAAAAAPLAASAAPSGTSTVASHLQPYRSVDAGRLLSTTRRTLVPQANPQMGGAYPQMGGAYPQVGGAPCPSCVNPQDDLSPYIVLGVLAMVPLVAILRRAWVRSRKQRQPVKTDKVHV
jgi:TM2 domain-containing membrane protein YozV